MRANEDQQADAVETGLTDDERALLDELAEGISKRRLLAPALFFLESVKPLGFVSSQVMHFFRPIVGLVWTEPRKYDLVAKLLERRGSIEVLLRRLEARA